MRKELVPEIDYGLGLHVYL